MASWKIRDKDILIHNFGDQIVTYDTKSKNTHLIPNSITPFFKFLVDFLSENSQQDFSANQILNILSEQENSEPIDVNLIDIEHLLDKLNKACLLEKSLPPNFQKVE